MRTIKQYKETEYYLYFDAITGIWNRYYFGIHDRNYREDSEKYSVAAIYISLKGLREINVSDGFSRGDCYVRAFSELLAAEFGKNVCYRMSGNEFLVLLEDYKEEDALAEWEALEDLFIKKQMTNVLSGFAWEKEAETLEDIVLKAEQKMYRETCCEQQKKIDVVQ